VGYVELLLLGTGKTMSLPPPAIREYLHEIGVQVDVMDTVSFVSQAHCDVTHACTLQKNACSTFNLLSEEGRRVAAALLPLGPITPWK
jgi:NADH dehydrogenase [ubiquinone] 1 alpha subcomplex assembly factor 3